MFLKICFCSYNLRHVDEQMWFRLKKTLELHIFHDLYGKLNVTPNGKDIRFSELNGASQAIQIELCEVENVNRIKDHLDEIKKIVIVDVNSQLKVDVNNSKVTIQIAQTGAGDNPSVGNRDEQTTEERAKQYSAKEPYWTYEQIILPKVVLDEIDIALNTMNVETKVFDEWGLRKIEPFARAALNFYGPPGTGKTMTAHAIANELHRRILIASYAEIESKYHGEGPKNVEAIFYAAQRDEAVLFIDEADSLLSKRLLSVTQGSEQAINSMRSQLLICLEKFSGIVIFATNLVKNYDYAFETRVKNINFILPDEDCRMRIWDVHLLPTIPKSQDISTMELAKKYNDFCGRDIKNAVVSACIKAAMNNETVSQEILCKACDRVVDEREKLRSSKDDTVKNNPIAQAAQTKIDGKMSSGEPVTAISAAL